MKQRAYRMVRHQAGADFAQRQAYGALRLAALLAVIATTLPADAAVKTGLPFQDNMVLQQGIPLPVWGTAAPGEKVTVQFAGQQKTVPAGSNGMWRLRLDPLRVSVEPRDMLITSATTTNQPPLILHGVLVGEVWLCSGQSNMELPVKDATNAATEIAQADYPAIRMLSIRGNRRWTVCASNTVGDFSATGYFFARELHTRLGVPVGMLNASQGSTEIQLWMTPESARTLPVLKDYWERIDASVREFKADPTAYGQRYRDATTRIVVSQQKWEDDSLANDPGMKERWYEAITDTRAWAPVALPMPNADAGLNDLGTVWLRLETKIPPEWVGRRLTLNLGPIDEVDDTYVNGRLVGHTGRDTKDFWRIPRVYGVPPEANTATNATITVRMINVFGLMGLLGTPEQMSLRPADDPAAAPVSLATTWHMRRGAELDPTTQPTLDLLPTPSPGGKFGGSYQSYIAPLIPYGIKGVLWYQGESNAREPKLYAALFPALIRSWREAWGQDPEKGFPFYYMQLAGHQGRQRSPIERCSWAELREAQSAALALPRTGVAVALDIGDAADIHPRNKQEAGKRLALWALAKDYGVKLECSGPTVDTLRIKGDQVILSFDHAKGLRLAGGTRVGFAIAGADKVFHPATATVRGSTVTVIATTGSVPKPVAVRYGWAYHPACFLYNAAGLPASPFRTDHWDAADVRGSE